MKFFEAHETSAFLWLYDASPNTCHLFSPRSQVCLTYENLLYIVIVCQQGTRDILYRQFASGHSPTILSSPSPSLRPPHPTCRGGHNTCRAFDQVFLPSRHRGLSLCPRCALSHEASWPYGLALEAEARLPLRCIASEGPPLLRTCPSFFSLSLSVRTQLSTVWRHAPVYI